MKAFLRGGDGIPSVASILVCCGVSRRRGGCVQCCLRFFMWNAILALASMPLPCIVLSGFLAVLCAVVTRGVLLPLLALLALALHLHSSQNFHQQNKITKNTITIAISAAMPPAEPLLTEFGSILACSCVCWRSMCYYLYLCS